ncbi:Uncharacterised protein [Pandoraea pnomenusa]|uniref:Uncharacterized protein n=1 Tax=Pandoraea pnomenusa TaxID=93220 RepID=A0A378YGU5_9BURK|nr:Uncharacterised protein [Pandoraea pnomenusa]
MVALRSLIGGGVTVAGNTDLKSAYIASTADPWKNQLTTGTLTFSDIQNHSDYSANSFGFGGGRDLSVKFRTNGI